MATSHKLESLKIHFVISMICADAIFHLFWQEKIYLKKSWKLRKIPIHCAIPDNSWSSSSSSVLWPVVVDRSLCRWAPDRLPIYISFTCQCLRLCELSSSRHGRFQLLFLHTPFILPKVVGWYFKRWYLVGWYQIPVTCPWHFNLLFFWGGWSWGILVVLFLVCLFPVFSENIKDEQCRRFHSYR